MTTGKDKRRSVRRKVDLILELYEPDGKLIVGVGRLLDLSLHGAHFETTLVLKEQQTIHLLLRLDETLLLEIPATIVRVKTKIPINTFGAEFVNLSPYSKEKINGWIQSQSKKA